MKLLIVALAITLAACATPQTGPPSSTQVAVSPLCKATAVYDCSKGYPIEKPTGPSVDRCDPSITNPYIMADCPSRRDEAKTLQEIDVRNAANANRIAAQEHAAWLYCDMQGQMASHVADRGGLIAGAIEGALAYDQIRRSCLQMKAAERAAE